MTVSAKQLEFTFTEKKTLVNTHLGQTLTSKMGITLPHEHVFNKYPHRCKAESESFTMQQLETLKKHNVKTIVDLTPYTHLGNYKSVLKLTAPSKTAQAMKLANA